MSPIFRVMSKLRPYIYLNTNRLYHFSSPTCHHFSFHNLGNDLVTNSGPKWSFLGLVSVLNPIGLDTKKPRNYLIVRGLSRIFRFSSEVHSGAGGTCSLCSKCVYISNLQNRNFAVPLICNLILRTPSRLLQHGFCQFIYNANIMLLPLSGKAEGSF